MALLILPLLQRICLMSSLLLFLFFFNDTATTEIYTLSLPDALPIYEPLNMRSSLRGHGLQFSYNLLDMREVDGGPLLASPQLSDNVIGILGRVAQLRRRSEEHTSELQSLTNLVCRLLLVKKKDENDV